MKTLTKSLVVEAALAGLFAACMPACENLNDSWL